MDGEITMFVLAGSVRGKWQVRFKNPLGAKPAYVRKSTGHANEALATARAIEIYTEYKSRSLLNMKTGKVTIDDLMEKYEPLLKKVTRAACKSYYQTYWREYFGDKDMSVITTADIAAYFDWKIANQKSIRERKQKAFSSSETSLSADNLKLERNCMRKLLKHAYEGNLVARMPGFPLTFEGRVGVHSLPRNERRGRFEPREHYRGILLPEFRRIRAGLQKKEWKPVLVNPELPFHKEENPWISIAKRDGISAQWQKNEAAKDFVSKKARYPSAVFYFASMLLAHTGIRVSEMVKLRHKDIAIVQDPDDGKYYTSVHISSRVSKVGKYRIAYADDYHKTYIRYLLYRDEIKYEFGIDKVMPNDFIFPQPGAYDQPRKKMNNLFRPRLKKLGLHEKWLNMDDGHRVRIVYSAYSFRSFFITQRLKHGMSVYHVSKLCGVSIQTLMSSYDVNQNWAFRRTVTRHVGSAADIGKWSYELTDSEAALIDAKPEDWDRLVHGTDEYGQKYEV
jgi:integrase